MNGELVTLLHRENCSCVVRSADGRVRTFWQRGVADLYDLYTSHPEWLDGADMADKVVGRGAAALMVLGNIRTLHAEVISTPALALLRAAGIMVSIHYEVPFIINRQGNGRCPLETATEGIADAQSMWPVILHFVQQMRTLKQTETVE